MRSKGSDLRPVRDQSLADLLGPLPAPELDSGTLATLHRLWEVPLKQLGVGDLRFLVVQGRGLEYLVPIALAHVVAHPLTVASYYPGDLLKALIRVPEPYWRDRPESQQQLVTAIERALPRLTKRGAPDELEPELRGALARLA